MNNETRNAIVTALSEISWCIGYANSEQMIVNLKVAESLLRKALNSLQEEPKEQRSGVWIDGEFREIRFGFDNGTQCPFCEDHICGAHDQVQGNYRELAVPLREPLKGFWLAPPKATQEPQCPDCKGEGVILRPSSDGKEGQEWPCPKNCQAVKELDSFYWQVVEDRRKQQSQVQG